MIFLWITLKSMNLLPPIYCGSNGEMIAQTGENGFHFVDEAAPPALMRALALEILRRKLAVTWWTTFGSKSFTKFVLTSKSFWLYRRFWRTQSRFGSLKT
jgi:hypothetical protein